VAPATTPTTMTFWQHFSTKHGKLFVQRKLCENFEEQNLKFKKPIQQIVILCKTNKTKRKLLIDGGIFLK